MEKYKAIAARWKKFMTLRESKTLRCSCRICVPTASASSSTAWISFVTVNGFSALDPDNIDVIRRETALEYHITNNQLTVSLSIDDLRVGDLVDFHSYRYRPGDKSSTVGKTFLCDLLDDLVLPGIAGENSYRQPFKSHAEPAPPSHRCRSTGG